MKKIGMTQFSKSGTNGTFSIIEKESGIAYMVRAYITISPTNTSGDWAILSKKGGNTEVQTFRAEAGLFGNFSDTDQWNL